MPHTNEIKTPEIKNFRHSESLKGLLFYRYQLIPVLISTAYALILTYLPVDQFVDRENYFIYARNSYFIQYLYGYNYISYLSNEPIWLFLNVQLYRIFNDDTIVRIFIFLSSFITAYVVTKNKKYNIFLLLMVLIVPGVIQNYITHIRQGVAISVFLIGYFSENKKVKYLFICAAPFIHSAFFIVSSIFLLDILLKFIDSFRPNTSIYLIFPIIIASVLLIEVIMPATSFRQVDEYRNIYVEISGIGFSIWLTVLVIFILNGIEYIKDNTFVITTIFFYLLIYFSMPFAGRVIECVIIPIYFSGLQLKNVRKWSFISIIFLMSLSFYYLNSGAYWFGWGI